MSWKFTDESSVTFQSSISGAGEFGHCLIRKKCNRIIEHIPVQLTIVLYYKIYPSMEKERDLVEL